MTAAVPNAPSTSVAQGTPCTTQTQSPMFWGEAEEWERRLFSQIGDICPCPSVLTTPVVLSVSDSVLPTPLGISDSVLTTPYSVLTSPVPSVPESVSVSYAKSRTDKSKIGKAPKVNKVQHHDGMRCWSRRVDKEAKQHANPHNQSVSRTVQPSFYTPKHKVPKTMRRNEYASPPKNTTVKYTFFHQYSGGQPTKDSKVAAQTQRAAGKKTSWDSNGADNSKSSHFRSIQGTRCWRSHKANANTTRVAGVWEHHEGKIIPASCSGLGPVRNLHVAEIATYPSRRRWHSNLIVPDCKMHDATNLPKCLFVAENPECLKDGESRVLMLSDEEKAGSSRSSESSSWRELHDDSDPECLIVPDTPECLTMSDLQSVPSPLRWLRFWPV